MGKTRKTINTIVAVTISFCLLFEQSGFAQVAPHLSIPAYLSSGYIAPDRFRPVQLRSIVFQSTANDFDLYLDRGDLKRIKPGEIKKTALKLKEYFSIGLSLPNDTFWVNLRPDAPDSIIDPLLEQTDIGKVMLEADLRLKKDLARFTSPDTAEGRQYWDKLYAKAETLFGAEDLTIPTITRPWIVPGEIILRQSQESAYIYKATLNVMLEQDYVKEAQYSFDDPRVKELNDYSSELIRQLIIPKLIREVNSSRKYAELRQVYYSLILAQWFKGQANARGSHVIRHTSHVESNPLFSKINSKDLSGLTSRKRWSKEKYFKAYQKSFAKGEYRLEESAYGPSGMTVRQYTSGGITVDNLAGLIGKANFSTDNALTVPSDMALRGLEGINAKGDLIPQVAQEAAHDGGSNRNSGRALVEGALLALVSFAVMSTMPYWVHIARADPEFLNRIMPFLIPVFGIYFGLHAMHLSDYGRGLRADPFSSDQKDGGVRSPESADPARIESLLESLRDNSPEKRIAALKELADAGDSEITVRIIETLRGEEDPDVLVWLEFALFKLELKDKIIDPQAVPVGLKEKEQMLDEAVNIVSQDDPGHEDFKRALGVIETLRDPRGLYAVMQYVAHKGSAQPLQSDAALQTLLEFGRNVPIAFWLDIFAQYEKSDRFFSSKAVSALEYYSGPEKLIINVIMKALNDTQKLMRDAALRVISYQSLAILEGVLERINELEEWGKNDLLQNMRTSSRDGGIRQERLAQEMKAIIARSKSVSDVQKQVFTAYELGAITIAEKSENPQIRGLYDELLKTLKGMKVRISLPAWVLGVYHSAKEILMIPVSSAQRKQPLAETLQELIDRSKKVYALKELRFSAYELGAIAVAEKSEDSEVSALYEELLETQEGMEDYLRQHFMILGFVGDEDISAFLQPMVRQIGVLGWVKKGYVRTGMKKRLLEEFKGASAVLVVDAAYEVLRNAEVSSKEIADAVIAGFDSATPEVQKRLREILAEKFNDPKSPNWKAGDFLAERFMDDAQRQEHQKARQEYADSLKKQGYLWQQIELRLAGASVSEIGKPGVMPKVKIAIIGGTGNIGAPLVEELREKGNVEVLVGSRRADPKKAIMTNEDAAAQADIVIITVPAQHYRSTVENLVPIMKEGSILVSMAVLMGPVTVGDRKILAHNPPAGFGSAAEEAEALVDAYADGTDIKVVSGMHNVPGEWHGDPLLELTQQIVLFARDEKAASFVANNFVSQISDLKPMIILDLKHSRYAEMLTSYIIRSKKELLRGRPLTELFYFIKEKVEAAEAEGKDIRTIDLLPDLLKYNREVLDKELTEAYAKPEKVDAELENLASDRLSLREKEYAAIGLKRYKDITSDEAVKQKITEAVEIFERQVRFVAAKANAVRSLNALPEEQTIDDIQASIRQLKKETEALSLGEMIDIAAAYRENLLTAEQKSLFEEILAKQARHFNYKDGHATSHNADLEDEFDVHIWESEESISAVRMLGALNAAGLLSPAGKQRALENLKSLYAEHNVAIENRFPKQGRFFYEFTVTYEDMLQRFQEDYFDLSPLAAEKVQETAGASARRDGGSENPLTKFSNLARNDALTIVLLLSGVGPRDIIRINDYVATVPPEQKERYERALYPAITALRRAGMSGLYLSSTIENMFGQALFTYQIDDQIAFFMQLSALQKSMDTLMIRHGSLYERYQGTILSRLTQSYDREDRADVLAMLIPVLSGMHNAQLAGTVIHRIVWHNNTTKIKDALNMDFEARKALQRVARFMGGVVRNDAVHEEEEKVRYDSSPEQVAQLFTGLLEMPDGIAFADALIGIGESKGAHPNMTFGMLNAVWGWSVEGSEKSKSAFQAIAKQIAQRSPDTKEVLAGVIKDAQGHELDTLRQGSLYRLMDFLKEDGGSIDERITSIFAQAEQSMNGFKESDENYYFASAEEYRPETRVWVVKQLVALGVADEILPELRKFVKARTPAKQRACVEEAIARLSAQTGTQKDGGNTNPLGGIDFRSLPATIQPASNAFSPAAILGVTVPQAALQAPLAELDKKWSDIQEKICKADMPYQELKEYVAICCSRKDASVQVEKIYDCVTNILKMEEERAVATAPELKEIIACLG